MKVVYFEESGGPEVLQIKEAMVAKKGWFSSTLEQQEVKMPEIKDNEVMIKVYAVGVNRGDLIDATTSVGVCPGLECSGIIEAVGRNVNCWKVGDRVCAILEGGGYAELVAVRADFLLPLPDDIDLGDAAGLPYPTCSIWVALFKMHDRSTLKDKTILIHEGTSAIGALAIKYAKYMGLKKVVASTGGSNMISTCLGYGADFCLDHTLTNFAFNVREKVRHGGVHFVLDYGASNLQRNIECCCIWGKVVLVDLHGKLTSSIDLPMLKRKQIEIKAIDLRSRDLVYKASVIAEVRTHLWPAVMEKKVVPVIERRFPVIEVQKAWNLFKKNDLMIGKFIVHVNFEEVTCGLKMD